MRLSKSINFILFYDSLIAFLTLPCALYLMLGEEIDNYSFEFIFKNTLVFGLVCISLFLFFQTYKGLWRYISLVDVFEHLLALSLSCFIATPLLWFMSQDEALPGFTVIVSGQVLLFFLYLPRFLYRLWYEKDILKFHLYHPKTAKPILILGTGHNAEMFIHITSNDPSFNFYPVGLISSDSHLVGRRFHGIPIVGGFEDIQKVLLDLEIQNKKPVSLTLIQDDWDKTTIKLIMKQATKAKIPLYYFSTQKTLQTAS